jgi:hypothetical protein
VATRPPTMSFFMVCCVLLVGEVRCSGCRVGFRCWVRLLCAPD